MRKIISCVMVLSALICASCQSKTAFDRQARHEALIAERECFEFSMANNDNPFVVETVSRDRRSITFRVQNGVDMPKDTELFATRGPLLLDTLRVTSCDGDTVTAVCDGVFEDLFIQKGDQIYLRLAKKNADYDFGELSYQIPNDDVEHITLETAIKEQRARKKASAELDCNITFVDRNYGFVRINAGAKGDKNRVLKGSELTVLRGGKKVCDLIVTQVTDTEAIAYVQDGTLGVNERVKVGDRVVAKRKILKIEGIRTYVP